MSDSKTQGRAYFQISAVLVGAAYLMSFQCAGQALAQVPSNVQESRYFGDRINRSEPEISPSLQPSGQPNYELDSQLGTTGTVQTKAVEQAVGGLSNLFALSAVRTTAGQADPAVPPFLIAPDPVVGERTETSPDNLTWEARFAGLQAEVDHLRSLDEQREMEILSLYADADGRRGPTGLGTDGRSVFPELARESQFIFRSSGGEFDLRIDGTLIARYEVNRRRDDGTGFSNTDQGFQTTGTRINFQGKLYEDYGYWVRFNADSFGDPSIDAILGLYHLNDHTTIVVGQFPSLLNREQAIPADKLQLQESSPTDYTFDPFGYKGVMLAYHTPLMVFRGIINDGYRSANNSAFAESSAAWALAGQVSGLVIGDEDDWPRFNNFTSRPGNCCAWLLNGAFHVQEGNSHDGNTGSSDDVFLAMAESSMEGNGWNFYASFFYRNTRPLGSNISWNDDGFVLLGGIWVARHFELYSRFDMTIPDSDRPTEGDEFRTLTAGVNFYPKPHTDNIKIGTEMLYMFDAEANSIVEPNVFSSVRASPAGDQLVVRIQAVVQW